MSRKRTRVWDLAKCILIIMVFLAHVPYGEHIWKTWVFSFHMPAFFLISGILMHGSATLENSFGSFLKKKAFRLLLPVPFFELLAYAEVLLHWHGHIRLAEFLGKYLQVDLWNHADWFLLSLFAAECLFYAVNRKRKLILPSAAGAFAAALFVSFTPLSRCLMSYCFVACGYLLKDVLSEDSRVFIPGSAVLFIGANLLNPVRLDMHNAVYGNPVYMFVAALSGSCLLFAACRRMQNIPLVDRIGQYSLIIMGTHMPVLEIAHRMTDRTLYVLVIAALIEIPAAYITGRILPFLRPKGNM